MSTVKKTKKTGLEHTRLYIWELPVRFFHWVNALAIVVLCITGYIIGDPPGIMTSNEAYQSYWFGTVRFIHFAAAFGFCINFLFRIYWALVGNQHARWKNFIPHSKAQFKEIVNVLKVDIFLSGSSAAKIESHGHNAVASMTYFVLFLAAAFQIISGFALYAPMSQFPLLGLFTWIIPVMGGDFAVRQWHHILMWFFIIFTLAHVYIVFYHDYVEKNGTVSAMVSGWKFVPESHVNSPKSTDEILSETAKKTEETTEKA